MKRVLAAVFLLTIGLSMGGCPRPNDSLEPNNTRESATRLDVGLSLNGRVIQGDPDVFVVTASTDQVILFKMASVGTEEEDCAAFLVVGPDETTLYQDTNPFCGREYSTPIQVEGASLEHEVGVGYELRVPAGQAGEYYLTMTELGQVDNVFSFSWRYELTLDLE